MLIKIYFNGNYAGMIVASEAYVGNEVCIGRHTCYISRLNKTEGYAHLELKEEAV